MAKGKGMEAFDPFANVLDDEELIDTRTRVTKSSQREPTDDIPNRMRINVVQPKSAKVIPPLPKKISVNTTIKPAPPSKLGGVYVDEEAQRIQKLINDGINKALNEREKTQVTTTNFVSPEATIPLYSMASAPKTKYVNGNPVLPESTVKSFVNRVQNEQASLSKLNEEIESAKYEHEEDVAFDIPEFLCAEQKSNFVVRNVDTGDIVNSVFYANRVTGTVVTFVLDKDDNPVNWATNRQAFPLLVKQIMNITFEAAE